MLKISFYQLSSRAIVKSSRAIVKKYVDGFACKWDLVLPSPTFNYNVRCHSASPTYEPTFNYRAFVVTQHVLLTSLCLEGKPAFTPHVLFPATLEVTIRQKPFFLQNRKCQRTKPRFRYILIARRECADMHHRAAFLSN